MHSCALAWQKIGTLLARVSCHLLSNVEAVREVWLARTPDEVLRELVVGETDALLVSLDLCGGVASSLLQRIRRRHGTTRVIGVTSATFAGRTHELLWGILPISVSRPELARSLQAGALGTMTSSLPAVPSILDEREDLGLTDRELEVLALIAEGQSNGSIAGALLIAEATVKRHVYQLMRKLEVRSRSQAVALARRLGAIGL